MDARTEVDFSQTMSAERSQQHGARMRGGMEGAASAGDGRQGGKAVAVKEPHVSVDPMRATDRYRLVMPYTARM